MIRRRILTPTLLVASAMLIVCIGVQTGDGYGSTTAGVDDAMRGGLMYDKWWVVLGIDPPPGDHPLYPPEGSRSGDTTFRCKECHGWDYKGADGAYAKGSSHYTGIPGVFGSIRSAQEMFDLLKFDEDTIEDGHGFGDYGMADQDIWDVVEFLETLVIDTDLYIAGNADFIGDEVQGEFNYTEGGSPPCMTCHGPDGNWINFHDPDEPEWVGTIAVENPWEFLHKGRIGQPGSAMQNWLDQHPGDDQGVADIGRYAQLNFPTGTCPGDIDADGFVGLSDLLDLLANWGQCP